MPKHARRTVKPATEHMSSDSSMPSSPIQGPVVPVQVRVFLCCPLAESASRSLMLGGVFSPQDVPVFAVAMPVEAISSPPHDVKEVAAPVEAPARADVIGAATAALSEVSNTVFAPRPAWIMFK